MLLDWRYCVISFPLPTRIDPAPISAIRLAAESWTVLFAASVTMHKMQKKHSGQHFWPNLFLELTRA
jgi:hypothetical protein